MNWQLYDDRKANNRNLKLCMQCSNWLIQVCLHTMHQLRTRLRIGDKRASAASCPQTTSVTWVARAVSIILGKKKMVRRDCTPLETRLYHMAYSASIVFTRSRFSFFWNGIIFGVAVVKTVFFLKNLYTRIFNENPYEIREKRTSWHVWIFDSVGDRKGGHSRYRAVMWQMHV